jgi:hypothetical protein
MSIDARRSEKGERTAYLDIGVWYDPKNGIHLTLPKSNWFHTTVSGDPASKRSHPDLFDKLTRILKEAGLPHPE